MSDDYSRPVTIGVAGGTGSGKTTVSNQILERVGSKHIAYIPHDAYYKDLSDLPLEDRRRINYDHPDSLDTQLMIEHIRKLQNSLPAEIPVYDFTQHLRTEEVHLITPQPIILVEGILIFVEREVRDLLDIKIYVDTDADIRFIRRLKRDIEERGRSADSVINQYLTTVRPMHLKFVEPTKRYADVIIPEGGFNFVAIDMIADRIRSMVNQRDKIE
ncbi:uridine kinase [Phototrophicus methaneseepsis]|uniref:Uridine kinase n=1 Tax=Phototrophicus methaneseepsis TaxID=2710758 RepID=A0A7S8IDN2_9CHLR|nr:uridine kinase [Phototrophicus methaneseepsis]QPC80983.1 uridine kinase [Phototrophicus methaneseepsis]